MATNMAETYRPNLNDLRNMLARTGLPEVAPKLAALVEAANALAAPSMTPEEFTAAMERYERVSMEFRAAYTNIIGRKDFMEDLKQTERAAAHWTQEGRRQVRQERAWAEQEARERAEAEQAAREAEARAIREAEERERRDREEAARIRRLLADNPDSGEANRIRQMLNLPPAPVP